MCHVGTRVARFIETEITTSRQADSGQETPSLISNRAAFDALLAEPGYLPLNVVAHKIEFVFVIALAGRARDHEWYTDAPPPANGRQNRRTSALGRSSPQRNQGSVNLAPLQVRPLGDSSS